MKYSVHVSMTLDDIEAEDLFEKFQKLLNESEGHQQRMYVNRIHHEILAQNRRIKEKREPHVRVFHFNETEEEENMKKDEEAAEKLKEDLERNLGVRVFLRKNGQQNGFGGLFGQNEQKKDSSENFKPLENWK